MKLWKCTWKLISRQEGNEWGPMQKLKMCRRSDWVGDLLLSGLKYNSLWFCYVWEVHVKYQEGFFVSYWHTSSSGLSRLHLGGYLFQFWSGALIHVRMNPSSKKEERRSSFSVWVSCIFGQSKMFYQLRFPKSVGRRCDFSGCGFAVGVQIPRFVKQ